VSHPARAQRATYPRQSHRTPVTQRNRRRRPSRPRAVPTLPPNRSELDELERAFAAAEDAAPPPAASFAALGLPQRLVTALERRGIRTPFPIQARTVPDALAGRDVLGRGQTGSGKTLAFGLPLLGRLMAPAGTGRSLRTSGSPRGLVLVPTRELAVQVREVLAPLGQPLDLRVAAIFGGASMRRQIDALRRGADVVVATPGRLLDLIEQGECTLAQVEITVLDEADHMADLGFLPAVTRLLDQTKVGGQRLLFSATLDRGVDRLVRAYLNTPATHAIAPAASPVSDADHVAFTVRPESKVLVATQIASRPGRTLLFVRTKHGADRLAGQLRRSGVDAGAIHGDLRQSARQRALEAFAAGRAPVLVATDVAARGIHVDGVDLVVHYDPPADYKDYLHRSGRTARAGAPGTVLSLLLPEQVRDAVRLQQRAGVRLSLTTVHPGHEAVLDIARQG
jgi:superfamily II DNA/RNA helicase